MDQDNDSASQRRRLPSLRSNEIERFSQEQGNPAHVRRITRNNADDNLPAEQFTESIRDEVKSDEEEVALSKNGENCEEATAESTNTTTKAKATLADQKRSGRRSRDRPKEKHRRELRGEPSEKSEAHVKQRQPEGDGGTPGGAEALDGSAMREKSSEACGDVSIRIGPTYRYDEHTGLLSPPGEGDGKFMKSSKMFVENAKTGLFRQVEESKWKGRDAAPGNYRTSVKPGRVCLTSLADSSSRAASKLATFMQGLLGGWSALNLFLIHIWGTTRIEANADSFSFKYYAPVVLTINRVYSSLLSAALVLSFSRYSYHHIQPGNAPSVNQKRLERSIIVLYLVAYTSSVLCTPLEDEIQLSAGKLYSFEGHRFHGGVFSKLDVWSAMSITRMVSSLLAWIMVCWGAQIGEQANASQQGDSISSQNRLPSAGQML